MAKLISSEERAFHELTMSKAFKPPDKMALKKRYDRLCPLYEQLIEEIQFILKRALEQRGIRVSDIQHRPKAFDSLYARARQHVAQCLERLKIQLDVR